MRASVGHVSCGALAVDALGRALYPARPETDRSHSVPTMHPDPSIIAALTGCTPERAQALEALITNGWAPPSVVTVPTADPEVVEPAAPPAPEDAPAKGLLAAHTDGACSGNPGPGGWAVVFSRSDKIVKEFSGGLPASTSNRMELTAVLEAVRRAPKGSRLEIHTDSRNVVGWLTKQYKRNSATLCCSLPGDRRAGGEARLGGCRQLPPCPRAPWRRAQ